MNTIGVFGGYKVSISNQRDLIRIEEVSETKSWKLMQDFCKRFPTGCEPQWDSFLIKQSSMQKKEIDFAVKSASRKMKEMACS